MKKVTRLCFLITIYQKKRQSTILQTKIYSSGARLENGKVLNTHSAWTESGLLDSKWSLSTHIQNVKWYTINVMSNYRSRVKIHFKNPICERPGNLVALRKGCRHRHLLFSRSYGVVTYFISKIRKLYKSQYILSAFSLIGNNYILVERTLHCFVS